jgi:hypothetical protein
MSVVPCNLEMEVFVGLGRAISVNRSIKAFRMQSRFPTSQSLLRWPLTTSFGNIICGSERWLKFGGDEYDELWRQVTPLLLKAFRFSDTLRTLRLSARGSKWREVHQTGPAELGCKCSLHFFPRNSRTDHFPYGSSSPRRQCSGVDCRAGDL